MNQKFARYLALLLLALPSAAIANNTWALKCEKKCSSCSASGGGTSCKLENSTYGTSASAPISDHGNGDGTDQLSRINQLVTGGYECMLTVTNPNGTTTTTTYGGSGASQSPASPAGITSANYDPAALVIQGVGPDYVKTESVGGVRSPKYIPVKSGGYVVNRIAGGFEMAHYLSKNLNAADSNGIRTPTDPGLASSVTIYRNPDFDANAPNAPSQGNMDVIHKQRHPQSGAWVTRTIRKHAPQNNNNWTTEFYLGDPAIQTSPSLQPYSKIAITRTPQGNGAETTHEVTEDLNGSTYVTTSDITRTYAFYKHGEPVILSETQHTGTGSELTTTWTYFQDSADQASFNKPATMRRSDGQWANYTYQGSPVTGTLVTKTVSGWLDNAAPAIDTAPDESANRVVIEFEAKNETGTIGREEKIQGVTISKSWGERYKANSGELVEKSHVETGTATLTTIRTGYPDNDSVSAVERGRLKSIQHPDGTVTLHRYAKQGENRVETIDTGAGSLSAVTDGNRNVSTYTKEDVLIAEVTSDIASDVELSARQAIAFDANDQPSRWAYDNNPDDYSETLNGCCGVDSTRSRDGVVTTYTRDALKRPKTAISQGITLTYTYGSKTIGGTEFPTENVTATAGSLSLDRGTTVHDLAGNVIEQISPDLDNDGNPETAATTRNFSTRTVTVTNPDGGTTISTDFADGQSKSTTGTATAPAYFSCATHNQQGGGLVTSQGPTATGPWSKSYKNLAGYTLKSTFNDGTTEIALQTNTYDNLGRLVSTKDADNVTQLIAYNAKGEACRRAIDLNQNSQIDNSDRITDSLQDIITNSPIGNALRSRSIIYDLANNPVTVSTTFRSPDGLITRQETLGVASPSTFSSASHTDRADGSWADTSTAPDGTKHVTTYANWLAVSFSSLNTANSPLEASSIGYDALLRSITKTHSRTGFVNTNYAASGQVASIEDHGRVTSFGYDSMGHRTAITLPDTSVSHISYWPTGQEKTAWGSQTNPTVKIYSPEGLLVELRTFRSTNLALVPDETTGSYDDTSWTYNARNQLTRKEYADSKGTDYTYTPAGRIYTRTWARGVVTTYSYNSAGELTTTDYSDNTPDVTIAFDKLGRQQSVTNGLATSIFTYDPATLRPVSETIAYDLDSNGTPDFTRVLDRSRDNLGRDTGFQLKDGTTIENQAAYGYNATDGRLATVRGGGDVSSPQTFSYGYVPNSNVLQKVIGPIHTVTNTWEPTRDVLASKQNKVGTDVISQYDYTVNAIGQRAGVNTSGTAFPALPSWLWGYDGLGQVTSADSSVNTSDRTYEYDAIGNRRKSADSLTLPGSDIYTSNALNQYSAVAGVSPSYDDDGKTTAYPLPIAPTTNSTLVWDGENRQISSTVGGATTTYLYDFQSRRIAKTTGGSSTLCIYDGWNCIAEYAGTTLSKTNLWGTDLSGTLQGAGGVGGLLAVRSVSATHFPAYDGNGNVSEYLATDGSITAHFEYEPFGNTVVNTDTGNQFRYRFSTKPLDVETGFYYYGYRYYDPVAGRWPSRDPIGENGGVNLYGFVGNDGVNRMDYLGLFLTSCSGPRGHCYVTYSCKFITVTTYPAGSGWIFPRAEYEYACTVTAVTSTATGCPRTVGMTIPKFWVDTGANPFASWPLTKTYKETFAL